MKAFVREKLSEIIRWPGFAALLVLVSVLMPCFIYWFHTGNSRGVYPGIRLDISGVQIQVDNESMDVENFLILMICVDYQPDMEEEALKAFAAAARSSLYAHLEQYSRQKETTGQESEVVKADDLGVSYGKPGEMVCIFQNAADEENGKHWSSVYQRVKNAVEKTAGQYLIYPEKSKTAPVDALWHECSARYTRFYEGNLTGEYDGISLYSPQQKSMDGKDRLLPESIQMTVYTRRQVAELLWEMPGTEDILSKETSLSTYFKIEKRDDTGYIETISLGNRKMTGEEAAQLLQISSGCFYVSDISEEKLKITVYGSGRGYGMSLAGASVMASQGSSYREILEYYFPVCTLNNLSVFRAQ